ncbi:MAG TPA: DinB family protein [Kiritimatiellia bacterium]|nr:DinB family protein [Kiritimatiellia bacterium]HMO99535.1 DinB family protein [Kiritimatiellia bacterium]HMP98029.1 DinB family protein [Kiritimatiellia bacterium]
MEQQPYSLLARYNQWMNEKLYGWCAMIPDDQRRTDVGAYFHSIHGTLNHLLHVDMLWLGRFTGKRLTNAVIGEDIHAHFDALWQSRIELDVELIDWTATLSPDWLAAPLTYVCAVDGRLRTMPAWTLVMQMFNHQVHHRGQLTTLLNQLGFDHGSTDIPAMPEFETCVSAC